LKFYRTLSKADWHAFRAELNKLDFPTSLLKDTSEVDQAIDHLTHSISAALEKQFTKVPIIRGRPRLPDQIIELISERNSIHRRYHRHPSPELRSTRNRLSAVIRRRIKQHLRSFWDHKLSIFQPGDPAIWKTLRRFKAEPSHIPSWDNLNHPTLPDHITDDRGKAELFAEIIFQRNHVELNGSNPDEDMILATRSTPRPTPVPILPADAHRFFTSPLEISSYIGQLRARASPGVDGISSKCVRYLPFKTLSYLSLILNSCLSLQYFPKAWKHAIICPIHKKNKPRHDPNSYRPISLLPTLNSVIYFE